MTDWDYFFVYSSVFSPLIPLSALIKKKYDGAFVLIILFVIASFASDIISVFLINGTNYTFLHGYGLVEALILFLFYYRVLKTKRWVLILAITFVVFYILNSLYFEVGIFNTIGRSVECLAIIFLALWLFYQFFRQEEDIFIERSPLFWINVGLLIYFSGAFFTFVFSKYILTDQPLWILHNVFNVLKNVFLAIGLWKVKVK